jgi:hypothetical protein
MSAEFTTITDGISEMAEEIKKFFCVRQGRFYAQQPSVSI